MHSSHQAKLLKAGYTIYTGTTSPQGLVIKAKTLDNSNWHTIEKGFLSKAQLKKRLFELDKKPTWIDLYDSKNNLTDNEKWDDFWDQLENLYSDGALQNEDQDDLGYIGELALIAFGFKVDGD